MISDIETALSILAATKAQTNRKRHRLTPKGRRILQIAIANLQRYQANRRAVS